MTELNKVVISGISLLGPNGKDASEIWKILCEQKQVNPGRFDGSVELANNNAYLMNNESRDDLSALIIKLVYDALEDAGLSKLEPLRSGVYVGSAMGKIDSFEALSYSGKDTSAFDLFSLSHDVASHFGIMGPNRVFSTACSASIYALGMAAQSIRQGDADVMLVIGAEVASRIVLSCFNRMNGVDRERCRPFDENRQGAVFGEGCGVIVLESHNHRMDREQSTSAYASVQGFGWSCDAHNVTMPDPEGTQIHNCLLEAVLGSELTPNQIDCIIPHGTGTPQNDQVEAMVIEALFSEKSLVTPIKGMLGHSAGAAGIFSTAVGAMICAKQFVPLATNLEKPEFSLNFPVKGEQQVNIDNLLLSGYAFGGNNASIVLRRENNG